MANKTEWVLLLTLVYLVPAGILFHYAFDTLLRNPRKAEFQLASLALFAVMSMFLEEFVRQLLPVSTSGAFVAFGFGNIGALSAAFMMHFYFKLSGFSKRIRPAVYLTLSYFLLIPSALTLLLQHNIYNSTHFTRVGPWIQPTYNSQYYTAMIVGLLVLVGLAFIMAAARAKTSVKSDKDRYKTMFYSTVFIFVWHVVFGLLPGVFPVFKLLPPYPYIFGDLVWLIVLRWSMFQQELLPPFGKQYQTLFNLVPAAIVVADDRGRVLEANPTARELFGNGAELIADFLRLRRDSVAQGLLPTPMPLNNLEQEFTTHTGTKMAGLVSADFVQVNGQSLSIWLIRDITDRKKAEQRIEHLAYYDALTDLPNRGHFYELFEQALEQDSVHAFAVLLIDIDNFKEVNDSFGHQVGDAAIQHVAAILKTRLQAGDIAARLGGDEFVMLLRQRSNRAQLVSEAHELVRLLNTDIAVLVAGADGTLQTDFGRLLSGEHDLSLSTAAPTKLSASVGVALFPTDGETPDALIRAADIAMYRAKHRGRNGVAVFSGNTDF